MLVQFQSQWFHNSVSYTACELSISLLYYYSGSCEAWNEPYIVAHKYEIIIMINSTQNNS